MKDAICVRNLCKTYPDFSLQNISLSLPQGCVMGLVGENGAGKTTLIKSLLGLIAYDKGSISLLGMDLARHEKEIKRQLGVVFDECCFHDQLRPCDIATILNPVYESWDQPYYEKLLRDFGISDKKAVKEFSRGMKMKLSIAAAMAHHPKLLILDEATSGLDPVVREEMLDLFMDFMQDETHSILLSSHITSDLEKVADYIAFIQKGQMVFCKRRDELGDKMGVFKSGEAAYRTADKAGILCERRSSFGVEALVEDRRAFLRSHPGAVVDPASIEQIMLFYARGRLSQEKEGA